MAEHATLAAALAAFQSDLPTIDKGQTAQIKSDKGSYSYQYADLADVSAVVMPLLAKQGLAFTAAPTFDGERFVLRYQLLHTSGDTLEGTYPLPNGQPQQVGSAITYARRYCLCAVTGVAPDEDDDGRAAQQAPARPEPEPVDLSKLREAIAASQARDIEGDYDSLTEWAAESQQNADAAVRKLRKAIDAYDDGTDEHQQPSTSEADRSGGDDGSEQASTSSPPDTSWRGVMEAAGVKGEDLLVRLIQNWPHDDQSAKPLRTNDLDRAAERHRDLVGQCIGELEDEKRGANA